MLRRVASAVAIAIAAAPVAAGPWPREPGERFLSFSATVAGPRQELAAYGETGLGRGWTLGLDTALDRDGGGRALLLVSRQLTGATARLRFSAEAGAGGYRSADGRTQAVLRGGVSAGFGWGGARPGWARLDLLAESRAGDLAFKTDATVGMRVAGRLTAILQVEGDWADRSSLVLAPGIVWRLRDGVDLHLRAQADVRGQAEPGLRLSTWIRF